MENPYAANGGLVDRAKAILTQPDETWPRIAADPSTPGDVLRSYALPLLILGPIAGFIGGQLFGISVLFVTVKPGLIAGLTSAIVSIVLGVISLFIAAWMADFLAPKFKGTSDRSQAFKLVAYSMTPAWIASILSLFMSASIAMVIGLISLYGIYLFYKGATPLMKVPHDQVPIYMVALAVVSIVLWIIVGSIASRVTGMMMPGASMTANDDVKATIPGVGTIDTSKMEAATKQMQAAANGEVKPIDGAQLQTLFPASLNGYNRTALEANAMGQMGTEAEATYALGDKSFRLKIVDSTGLGAIAGLGGAMGVAHSREDADGYERAATVDGQMQVEKWDNKSHDGSFTQQIASRFMITAEGQVDSIDQLKSAVAAVDQGKLASLAK
ncbi:MAG: Yip1 family protein [Novosphingobium sp.]